MNLDQINIKLNIPSNGLVVIEYNEQLEDYTLNIPFGISRCELIELVDELKRLTQWGED